MIFLGYEKPVEQGRELVFDPVTAQMVLNANRDYINAVYRDYQQAMADMKEFNEKYGDFTSPILADMDWYYNNVTGRVKNFINDLYARGIDPLRSQEGRAAVAKELATMPTKGIADVRLSAEVAKDYVKAMGALAAQGKYNADLERMAGRDLSNWSTMGDPKNGTTGNGVWRYSSPAEYKDLNLFTSHIFDKMQDEYIGTIDGYDYSGVSKERREKALASQIGDIMSSDLGRFHYAQSKSALEALLGRSVSDAEALEAFKNDILASTTEYERRNRTENKEYARQRDYYYDNKLDAAKKERDYYYESVKPFDIDDNGKLDDNERELRKQYKIAAITGGNEKDKDPNVFREAEDNARYVFENTPQGQNAAGLQVKYVLGEQYFQKIDPIIQSKSHIEKNKGTGETREVLTFRKQDILKKGSMYNMWDNGSMHPLSWVDNKNIKAKEFRFVPDGNMRAVYNGTLYKYYISGTMTGDDGSPVFEGKRVWIRVKERMNNYGQTQKKK